MSYYNLFLDNITQTTHFSLEFALNRISLFIIFHVKHFFRQFNLAALFISTSYCLKLFYTISVIIIIVYNNSDILEVLDKINCFWSFSFKYNIFQIFRLKLLTTFSLQKTFESVKAMYTISLIAQCSIEGTSTYDRVPHSKIAS